MPPSLEAELERARELSVAELADAIESIGFECTRCGACCKGYETDTGREDHTATVFPDEVRALEDAADEAFEESYDWRDLARPMPYGLREGDDGPTGETLEWSLAVDDCGDCTFYREEDGTGACAVHGDRPLVCRTYPFSVVLGGDGGDGGDADDGAEAAALAQPMGEAVDSEGPVRAHECEGLGRDIPREDAEDLAAALKRRAVRELEEAIALRERYEPRPGVDGVVVHDSEGAKRPNGTPAEE